MPEHTSEHKWYALTVPYQHERQTEKALQSKGLETLVPVYRSRRQWSDRVKEVEMPLFAGYVLCQFDLTDRIHVTDTPGVAKIVGFGGSPAALQDSEIAAIQQVVALKMPLAPWPYLKTGDRVRVEHGPLKTESGRFVGRIWVEDAGNSIVRSNGTYSSAVPSRRAPIARYFQFDSWRVNVDHDQWVPSQIYVEEQGSSIGGRPAVPRFKAQTRIWGYDSAVAANKWDELTQILIEPGSEVKDHTAPKDLSPLESQRIWERQAEDNVVARLEKSGLLAPPGPVDDLLNTVVNNLIVSANLNVEAHCRVLLTTPLETFSVGHTIVISRGLIDVLPDEAAWRWCWRTNSLTLRWDIARPRSSRSAIRPCSPTPRCCNASTSSARPAELEAAGKKTIEIMRASPYQKTANAGLFLKALGQPAATCSRGSWPRILETSWPIPRRWRVWPNSRPPRPSCRKTNWNRSPRCRWARALSSIRGAIRSRWSKRVHWNFCRRARRCPSRSRRSSCTLTRR